MAVVRWGKSFGVVIAVTAALVAGGVALAATDLRGVVRRAERVSSHQKAWIKTVHTWFPGSGGVSSLTVIETYSRGEDLDELFTGRTPKSQNLQILTLFKHDRFSFYGYQPPTKRNAACLARNGAQRHRPIPVTWFDANLVLNAKSLGYAHRRMTFRHGARAGEYEWRITGRRVDGTITITHGRLVHETVNAKPRSDGQQNPDETAAIQYPHSIRQAAFRLPLRVCATTS